MIRILAVFFVCLISISAQDSGLQVSIRMIRLSRSSWALITTTRTIGMLRRI